MTEPTTDHVHDEDDYAPEPKRSPWAIVSMILGIIALTLVGRALGIIGLFAIIFGHMAMHDIKRGTASGKQMAIVGLGFGYLSLVITFLINFMNNA